MVHLVVCRLSAPFVALYITLIVAPDYSFDCY